MRGTPDGRCVYTLSSNRIYVIHVMFLYNFEHSQFREQGISISYKGVSRFRTEFERENRRINHRIKFDLDEESNDLFLELNVD